MAIPKIFINLDGGLITQILSDQPIEVIIADFDLDGLDEDRITEYVNENDENEKACIHVDESRTDGSGSVDLEPETVEKLFTNIKKVINEES